MYRHLIVRNLFWKSQFAFDKPREMFPKILTKPLEHYISMKRRITIYQGGGTFTTGNSAWLPVSRIRKSIVIQLFKKLSGSQSVPSSR